MSAPDRAELVLPGQQGVGVVCHIGNAEIVDQKGIAQDAERQSDEHELAGNERRRRIHQANLIALRADQAEHGDQRGEPQ